MIAFEIAYILVTIDKIEPHFSSYEKKIDIPFISLYDMKLDLLTFSSRTISLSVNSYL